MAFAHSFPSHNQKEKVRVKIMEKCERGRSNSRKCKCKGVEHQKRGYGFDAVKIFQHLQTLFIKL
ncbi:unnamed protein product [Lupinus luteus]|uniref:Uncharacterized protein n=1 Tax=Lupinus luteus TaxID=3873 RepID=A0AAV1WYU6_LUPLU